MFVLLFSLCAILPAQYQARSGGAPPSTLPEAVRATLVDSGVQVVSAKGDAAMQFWFRKEPPKKAPSGESGATLSDYAHGTFFGVVQVGDGVNDRRGDRVAPGLYALRLSAYPEDGAHQGVAPQRDFFILTKAETDTDPNATPGFLALMKMAQVASGRNHPMSLSCWKQESDFTAGISKMGESDIVLQVKVGDLPLGIIVMGKHEG